VEETEQVLTPVDRRLPRDATKMMNLPSPDKNQSMRRKKGVRVRRIRLLHAIPSGGGWAKWKGLVAVPYEKRLSEEKSRRNFLCALPEKNRIISQAKARRGGEKRSMGKNSPSSTIN